MGAGGKFDPWCRGPPMITFPGRKTGTSFCKGTGKVSRKRIISLTADGRKVNGIEENGCGRHHGVQRHHDHRGAAGERRDCAGAYQLRDEAVRIEQVIRETAAELGVEHALIRAVDKGALDCTVRARAAAALFRAAESENDVWEVGK